MRVFLSHSYKDNDISMKVRNYLVHHGIDVFDDKNDIATGANLKASINRAICESDAVLFFVSKNSEKSQWVQQEISLAVSNRLKGKDVKLIPVVLDKGSEIPFFLKDYLYLDISKSKNFESSMAKLVEGIKSEYKTTIKEELEAKGSEIEIEREFLKLKIMEHEELKKFKIRQMLFVSMIVTLVSAIIVSAGVLGWATKTEYSNFEWLIAFLVGAITSMLGSIFYMRAEQTNKGKAEKKIIGRQKAIKGLGVRNDQ